MEGDDPADPLTALAGPLGALGLNVLLPLSPEAFATAAAPLRLEDLLAGAAGAVIVGSGGPAFFDLFEREPEAADGAPNPLDRYTARIVPRAAGAALASLDIAQAFAFPFDAQPLIPFQRIGRAAGLGGPGPLGLQIHPRFGPWWAYRALLVLDRALPPRRRPATVAPGVPRPASPRALPARSGGAASTSAPVTPDAWSPSPAACRATRGSPAYAAPSTATGMWSSRSTCALRCPAGLLDGARRWAP